MIEIKEKNFNIAQIAESGQIFRFVETNAGEWLLHAGDRKLIIYTDETSVPGAAGADCQKRTSVRFDCTQAEFDGFWRHYFDLDTDYEKYIKAVPESDKFLSNAVRCADGIRILNQDPWEMLISFIISQRKSIPAIRTSIEKLCEKFGRESAFPSPKELAGASLDELLECSLGYRAPYIYEAARKVAAGEYDIYAWADLDDDELRAQLLSIRGVGIKVANCIMLFGYHRIASFPVDVWIQRIMDTYYDGEFDTARYEGYAGVMQQYMFAYARLQKSLAFA